MKDIRWAYLTLSGVELQGYRMNDLGDEGWECFKVIGESNKYDATFYFKRMYEKVPKVEEVNEK